MPVEKAEKELSLSTVGASTDSVNRGAGEYLSDVSPKHKPWDKHRAEADEVKEIYAGSRFGRHRRYAQRVEQCSQVLQFARDPPAGGRKQKLTLKGAWFCRVRQCPVCQWRRSLMWQAKVYRALPALVRDYPTIRFLFITLTIRNCEIENLRATLKLLAQGWQRMSQLAIWPALGWVRAVEITRGRDGSAHPHYHALLMVPPTYFQADYLKQSEWAWLWQECLRVNYRPVIDVRTVKADYNPNWQGNASASYKIWGAIVEILKYTVKVSDMVRDHDWFLGLVDQVHKMRAVAVGGILKRYIKDREKERMTDEPGEESPADEAERIFFGWKQEVRRYKKVS
jgi:plasmid rolling circle replication initiator protein Rep